MRRMTGLVLGGACVLALLVSACSANSVSLESLPGSVPSQVPASAQQSPLPEATLGAQETAFVGVTLYLKSVADSEQKVTVAISFQDNGKQFAKARVTEVLGPHERASLLVKPKYTGRVPMGYTSEITGVKAVDATGESASIEPSPSAAASQGETAPTFTNSPEPSAGDSSGAVAPSAGENENLGPGDSASSSAALIESAGDYVCHAGIDSLPNLQRGSTSQQDVQALQVVLDQLGFPPGPFDGRFGRRTEAAVKGFQSANGLTVDGLVGPATWTALVNSYC